MSPDDLASLEDTLGLLSDPEALAELADVLLSRVSGRPSGATATVENVVLLVRGPRVLAAVMVGAARARKLVYDNPLAVVCGEQVEAETPIPWAKGTAADGKSGGFLSRFFGSKR